MTQKKSIRTGKGKKVSGAKGKNWLLAVDPYGGFDIGPLRDFAVSLARKANDSVIAAYVLAPASLNWTGEFSGPWMKQYKPLAEEALSKLFPDGQIETTVVPCKEAGLRASAHSLARFAQKIKADAIVISTHARRGLERLALGSFAETLILTSKTPVLVVNPANPVPKGVRRILVPTDLSKKSEKHVLASAELAHQLGAEIVLFYKQPDPLDPIIQQGVYALGGGWVSVQDFVEEEIAAKEKELDRLCSVLAKKGVTAERALDASPSGLLEAINAAVKSHQADLVTVWTHAGPISAAILGSVARGLVRNAQVPVLVRR